MNDVTVAKPKPADLVTEFINLRREKERFEEVAKETCRELYDNRMNEIEQQLLGTLQDLGVDSISSKKGTVYRYTFVSVTTADGREFRRHVIGTENWDLADWRPNKTQINELVERGEPIPPGINRTQILKLGIRSK